jgi:hypothetical protein
MVAGLGSREGAALIRRRGGGSLFRPVATGLYAKRNIAGEKTWD